MFKKEIIDRVTASVPMESANALRDELLAGGYGPVRGGPDSRRAGNSIIVYEKVICTEYQK